MLDAGPDPDWDAATNTYKGWQRKQMQREQNALKESDSGNKWFSFSQFMNEQHLIEAPSNFCLYMWASIHNKFEK